ncbi:hypothetical protein DPMN_043853 [Dreissena polymorpha]|uniref:Uncharacterized protein n=1 Tax=Dreissena polymorpha TaxID=45954 RepID=A0A9D4D3H1_DREPO|nr:hypothetical protein DPMN_043853 [Dreissena polymorpha]
MDRAKLIDVDTASEYELRMLPSIGPKVAQSIITYREMHGRITRYDLAIIPYLKSSPLLWSLITFSKSEGESMIGIDGQEGAYKEMEKDQVFGEPVTNLGQDVITRVSAAINSANLSGPPSSYVKTSDVKVADQGAKPKVAQHKTEALWYKGSVDQSGPHWTSTPAKMSHPAKSVQHQAAPQPKVELGWQHGSLGHSVQNRPATPAPYTSKDHGMQAGPYQAMAQMPMAHRTDSVQFNAMTQGAQPLPYHAMMQVPVSQGGQGQLIDPVNQHQFPYMFSPGQSSHGMYPVHYHAMAQGAQPMPYQAVTQVPVSLGGQVQLTNQINRPQYVTSTPVVTAPQVDRSGTAPRLVTQSAVNATRGVSENVAAPAGQRALPPGQQKSRLQSLPKALVHDGRGSWQAFLTKFDKYSAIFEWEMLKRETTYVSA